MGFCPRKIVSGSSTLSGTSRNSTELAAAAHAFLNYSKTDMLVNFWENLGEHDERISRLMCYLYTIQRVNILSDAYETAR